MNRSEDIDSNAELRTFENAIVNEFILKRGCPRRFLKNTRKQMRQFRIEKANNYEAGVLAIPYAKVVSDSICRALLPLGVGTTFKP